MWLQYVKYYNTHYITCDKDYIIQKEVKDARNNNIRNYSKCIYYSYGKHI